METKVKNKKGLMLTILFISLLQMGGMGLSPSLAAIAADMPDVPLVAVQTLTSFPSFMMIFVCLIANKMVFKVGKKPVLLTGIISISAVGILGYLFNSNIIFLYVWAALLGVGFGTILPTTSGVLAENFDEKERGSLMGVQSVFTNIGAMYLTYVGGWVAAISWHMNYLVYLIAVIPLVFSLIFLPNDKPEAANVENREDAIKVSTLNKTTWIFGAITFVFMILYGVHSANIAFFVVERNLGSPALTGTIMAVVTLGGMIGGATFGFVNKIFKTYTFAVAFVLMAAGLIVTILAGSLPLIFIGALMIGCSISWDIPQSMLSITNANRVEAAALACSVAHIGGQIGTFGSSIVMTNITSALGYTTVAGRYTFTAVVSVIAAVVVAIIIKMIKTEK